MNQKINPETNVKEIDSHLWVKTLAHNAPKQIFADGGNNSSLERPAAPPRLAKRLLQLGFSN